MRLRYTRPALADLDGILDYIAARSPQGAQRVQQRLRNVVELLTTDPHIGRKTSNPVIRRLVVSPYHTLYSMKRLGMKSSSTPFDTRRVIPPACRVLDDPN